MIRKIAITLALVLGGILVLTSLAIAVLYFSVGSDHTVPATTADDPSLPFVELEGYRFHAEIFGAEEDPLVIVLHGGPGGDYRSIMSLRALADNGYRVLFYDQRGSGLSPRVEVEELVVDRFVADLDLFIEDFSPGKPVAIIGHSWGAMLASIYIGSHPEKVEKMILAEPGMLDNESTEEFFRMTGLQDMKMTGPMAKALAAAWAGSLHVKGPDEQARRDYFSLAFAESEVEGHPLAGYYRDDTYANAAGESWRFGSLASSSIPASGRDEDGKMTNLAAGGPDWIAAGGKALFLTGSENNIIGGDFQRRLRDKHYPGAELLIIEGAGHTMFGEKPEECLKATLEFLGN